MKKKVFVGVVLAVMFGALSVLNAAGRTETAAPAGPVKIVYWRSLTGKAGDVQEQLVADFNASQDKVVVESQFQGSYTEIMQKIMAALAAGEMPDVVMLDSPFVLLLAKDGVLADMDRLVAADTSGFKLSDFIPGLMKDGYYDGKLVAMPVMRSTPLLYVNGDMLAEAGLPRRAPQTWDELREFSARLTKFDAKGEPIQQGVGFTISQGTAHWYFQGAVYSYGGRISDDDFNFYLTEEPVLKVATLWQDMVFKDKTAIPSKSHDDFFNRKVAMVFGSTGSMGNLLSRADFQVIPAFMPAGTTKSVPVGGSVLGITSTDKRKQEASWEFIKYMASPKANSQIVIETGYMPTSNSAIAYPDTVAYFEANPERKVAIDNLEFTQAQASALSLGKGTEIFRQMAEKLLVLGTNPRQVLAETNAELVKEYNESFK